MAVVMDIEVPRNGDYSRTSQLVDTAGVPIDLTGHTLELSVRAAAGVTNPIITSGIITIEASTHGIFDELIHGADFAAIEGTEEVVRLAYDLRRTDPTGTKTIERRGAVILTPGVV